MKRKLLLVIAFIALPGFVHALGLGKLQLDSALNQPFDARITLLSATADELDSLNVGLADTEAFRRANIDRPFILSKLRFEVVQTETGSDYIHISSREAIREPFLNFLLEASWSSGRLYREYTVLLDPPLYDPNARRAPVRDSYSSPSPSTSSYIEDGSETSASTSSPVVSYSGNDYGPTDGSDTLWSIATQVRPDSSISVQQMMMALLRANPEAFLNGNINNLRRGQILSIPDRDEITSLSQQAAIDEVKSQNSDWQDARGIMSEETSERAETSSPALEDDAGADDELMTGEESVAEVIEDEESELRLVAASSDGEGIGQSGGLGGAGSADLTLATEQLEVVSQENAELKDRLDEAETIISDLKRLIALKDDELATIQQQIAGGGVVSDPGVIADESMPSDAAMEEEAEVMEEPMDDEDAMPDEAESMGMEEEVADEEESMPEELMETDESMEDEGEEMFAEEEPGDESAMEAEDEEVAAGEAEPVDSAAATAPSPPQSMLDKVLGFVMANLILIAGALGAVIIVIALLLFISRRKQNAVQESDAVGSTEFPDFSESEEEAPPPPAANESDMASDSSEDETVLPEGGEEEEDATEFVAPGESVEAEEESSPEPEPVAEEPEEDPLAEVNVFLAYEHFDQAEEFVRDAIADAPDNLDFHSKLLEVFYAANDKKSYEDAAQVLHDKVNGEGPHWEMALAMWQEISPNRALFEEGADDDDAAPAAAGGDAGGFMDITAEEDESPAAADAGVDFDLGADAGGDAAEEAMEETATEEEDVLDITSGGDDENMLDVTTAAAIAPDATDEDLLDVTAAVGLETEELPEPDVSASDEEPMLDITAGAEIQESPAEEDDVLDISHGSGEDLLDVTDNANLEEDALEEDLLDVTSSVGADADGEEELLEVSTEDSAVEEDNSVDFDIGGMEPEAVDSADDGSLDMEIPEADAEAASDDGALDFDIGGDTGTEEAADESTADGGGIDLEVPGDEAVAEDSADDNALDFDIGGMEESEPEQGSDDNVIDFESGSDDAPSLDLDSGDDGGVELVLSMDDVDAGADAEPVSAVEDDGLEIDLSIDDDDAAPDLDMGDLDAGSDDAGVPDLEMDLSIDEDASGGSDDSLDMDFDLEIEEDNAVPELDMDGTVEMPKPALDEMGIDIDDDDDDDDDHTVFVPRAGAADEQTAEDEIATKLDLAKAYVELGDKDSAKGILDEIMADGSDEQKQIAQDLMSQLG